MTEVTKQEAEALIAYHLHGVEQAAKLQEHHRAAAQKWSDALRQASETPAEPEQEGMDTEGSP